MGGFFDHAGKNCIRIHYTTDAKRVIKYFSISQAYGLRSRMRFNISNIHDFQGSWGDCEYREVNNKDKIGDTIRIKLDRLWVKATIKSKDIAGNKVTVRYNDNSGISTEAEVHNNKDETRVYVSTSKFGTRVKIDMELVKKDGSPNGSHNTRWIYISSSDVSHHKSAKVTGWAKAFFREVLDKYTGSGPSGWWNHRSENNLRPSVRAQCMSKFIGLVNPATRKPYEHQIGQDVAANWKGKGTWYKAVITNIEAEGKFRVRYTDFGRHTYETVTLDSIRALPGGRRLMEARDVNAMSPSELVLHRRRRAYGVRVSPVLAALMDEIEEAQRNHAARYC